MTPTQIPCSPPRIVLFFTLCAIALEPELVNAQQLKNLVDAGAEARRNSAGNVVELDLKSVVLVDDQAEEIAGCEQIVKLVVNESKMTLAGWKQLGKLKQLQQFDLRGCKVSNAQLIAAVSTMPKLRALRLNGKTGSMVDDVGLKALKNCPELKALAIDHLWVGAEGMAHLANCKKLAEIYAAGSLLDDEALSLLGKMPALRKLRLAQTTVTGEGLAKLMGLPLQDLDISECSQIDDSAMQYVGKFRSLKRLNLWRDAVSDAGAQHLAALTNLEWLNLDNTQVSDAGLKALAGMQSLSFLHLGSTSVSDSGMPELGKLKGLKDLRVTRTAVTQQGVEQVIEALGNIKVQLKYIEGQ